MASIAIKVRDKSGNDTGERRENQQKIKLKKLAYLRKVQYQMQHNEDGVKNFLAVNNTPEEVEKNIGNLIIPYKEGAKFADLPTKEIFDLLMQYKELLGRNDEFSKKARKELAELDAAEDLKSGVVANMVGVIAFLLERYHYNAFISLENLCRAYNFATDGITGAVLPSTAVDKEMDFKEQENRVLAGVGTYQFFEMQLLKKLFRIQKEKEIYHLVPPFRSVDNYEQIRKLSKKDKSAEFVCKPYGAVHFVDPRNTSQKCPVCGGIQVQRISKQGDSVVCSSCGFQTSWGTAAQTEKNNELLKIKGKQNLQLHFIKNGDDNGAYHIALKTLENLKKRIQRT